MQAPLVIVNPEDREPPHRSPYVRDTNRYVLSFGAYGTTHLMVWGRSLEDALETAAEWLAENAPGHIMPAWGKEHTALVKEACEERGLPWPIPEGVDPEDAGYLAAQEDAENDLTCTESGYLTSYEWFITLDEHATRADVKEFIVSLSERHCGKGPVVDITRPVER